MNIENLKEFSPDLKIKNINNISIRFRNSGSKYKPFNICFMRLFNNLQNYDPDYHQITIEEYNYKRKILINEINKGTIL